MKKIALTLATVVALSSAVAFANEGHEAHEGADAVNAAAANAGDQMDHGKKAAEGHAHEHGKKAKKHKH